MKTFIINTSAQLLWSAFFLCWRAIAAMEAEPSADTMIDR